MLSVKIYLPLEVLLSATLTCQGTFVAALARQRHLDKRKLRGDLTLCGCLKGGWSWGDLALLPRNK